MFKNGSAGDRALSLELRSDLLTFGNVKPSTVPSAQPIGSSSRPIAGWWWSHLPSSRSAQAFSTRELQLFRTHWNGPAASLSTRRWSALKF
jgi:hypothetical protein